MFKITLLACFALVIMTNCDFSPENKAQKVEEAKVDLAIAKQELAVAREDSLNTYLKFEDEVITKLKANQMQITALKNNIKTQSKELRADYELQVNALEKKNADLVTSIKGYKEGTKEKWAAFRLNFNREMDDLGKTMSELAQKNMKK